MGELPRPLVPDVEDRFGLYSTGIGGTGVITANRVLATAADDHGLVVEGMHQTGLSQKAGAVVSHLQFSHDRSRLGAASVGTGGADAYLSGDRLQAAGATHLDRVAPGRTISVVDSSFTPTAAMLQGGVDTPDLGALMRSIADRVGAGRSAFVDSKHIADVVFANHLQANILLLGAAFQMGALPLPLDAFDAAFDAQGRFGATNRLAFTWGRWAVHDPDAVRTALHASGDQVSGSGPGALKRLFDPSERAERRARRLVSGPRAPDQLIDLVTRRAAQVVDYQDVDLAERYLALVQEAVAVDDEGHDWQLTRAVADGWFKVLADKDEYEVARLHRKADYEAAAREMGLTAR